MVMEGRMDRASWVSYFEVERKRFELDIILASVNLVDREEIYAWDSTT
jgi:hypothetical protein